ncbi:M48 family metallopeptidase [Aquirufa ecclesiirivi]
MKRSIQVYGISSLMILFGALFVISCAQNALTGKSQLSLVSEQEIQALSLTQYQDFLKTSTVISPAKDAQAQMVQRVGKKITASVEKYFAEKNNKEFLKGYQWEYNLVKNDTTINAWCMPGGKIVVYTGILPVTKNETALAFVMGHEVSHALLQHGNKRMSETMIQELGGTVLSAAISSKPKETQDLFMRAYGIGTSVGIMLPFSREQELEADKFGLMWAAKSGYDPSEASAFWERMQKSKSGQAPPEFLSTHPSDVTRIQKIKEYLPEALKYYKK